MNTAISSPVSPPDSTAASPASSPSNVSDALDVKALQARAAEQIEAAILQTTTSPAERAQHIQAIKAAYIKACFGIEMKLAPEEKQEL